MFPSLLHPAILLYASILRFPLLVLSKGSAWNGQVTPGMGSATSFQPYYVPPGAKAYTSESRFIHYTGGWVTSYSNDFQGGVSRWTYEHNASLTFTFEGSGIELFGATSRKPTCSHVYLDGKYKDTIRHWSNSTLHGQRLFFALGLCPADRSLCTVKHLIKIVNCGSTNFAAFVVTKAYERRGSLASPAIETPPNVARRGSAKADWGLLQKGSTGVNAMQITIVSETHALIVDKVEHNPLTINGHPAWASLYDLNDHSLRPLNMRSNSFCAGGSFLSDGTLLMAGGNPVVEDRTGAADFGDTNGLQAIRKFGPCPSDSAGGCTVREDPSTSRLASPRWYTTLLRLDDGSAMIIGGSKKGGWINNVTVNNPTVEYYPPKNIHGSRGLPIKLAFLERTLPSNLFPIAFLLPDKTIFMAANQDAIIYDWKSNTERRLPPIPNGVRVSYPFTGSATLLPLAPSNNYTPEVFICGGSTIDDSLASYQISSQDAASSQCSRIVLSREGIEAGWQVEHMPEGRIMPDLVALPTGQYVIVNGAGSGMAGYGNVRDRVGESNADNARLTAVLYDPRRKPGQRFSTIGMPTSNIPRMYHSVATLTPAGSIMIAGSNPNLDRSELQYGTEYRVEWLSPPYMSGPRPTISSRPVKPVQYAKAFELRVDLPTNSDPLSVQVVLMDLGYVTHSIHANSRVVYLDAQPTEQGRIEVVGPPDEGVYPPGPGWLSVVLNGVPSQLVQVLIGSGASPAVDEDAQASVLKHSTVPSSSGANDGAE